jgi:hypothetical protein
VIAEGSVHAVLIDAGQGKKEGSMAGNKQNKNNRAKRPGNAHNDSRSPNKVTVPKETRQTENNEEVKPKAEGRKSYADVLTNEKILMCTYPQNLAPHLRKLYRSECREPRLNNDKSPHNSASKAEIMHNGSTGAMGKPRSVGTREICDAYQLGNPYGGLDEANQGRQIPEEFLKKSA